MAARTESRALIWQSRFDRFAMDALARQQRQRQDVGVTACCDPLLFSFVGHSWIPAVLLTLFGLSLFLEHIPWISLVAQDRDGGRWCGVHRTELFLPSVLHSQRILI
jgi:hypothetical protein